jgi:ABC-type uncharacterized transport system substrate-binding protein
MSDCYLEYSKSADNGILIEFVQTVYIRDFLFQELLELARSKIVFFNKLSWLGVILAMLTYFGMDISAVQADSCRILVVMSYEEDNPWCKEIKEGIDSVLENRCNIEYFYMDTKKDFEGGLGKGKRAYDLYVRLHPDGVIAADDNAQSMFVVPYLKDTVKTPVMFCGVNDDAAKYGYPARNVSGILERVFISQSIAFAKQLIPSISTVGFLSKDSPSGRAVRSQVEREFHSYILEVTDFSLVSTIKETLVELEAFTETSDVLFVEATNGILDSGGKPLDNKEVTKIIAKAFGKPLIGANRFHVKHGVLCAVVKSGQTQGRTAAEMLVKAMNGTPISQIPITVNKHGNRVMNLTAIQSLGIRPRRRALIGTELVRTTE